MNVLRFAMRGLGREVAARGIFKAREAVKEQCPERLHLAIARAQHVGFDFVHGQRFQVVLAVERALAQRHRKFTGGRVAGQIVAHADFAQKPLAAHNRGEPVLGFLGVDVAVFFGLGFCFQPLV